jgi:uncharacterized protein YjbI with pentapeptide repeats
MGLVIGMGCRPGCLAGAVCLFYQNKFVLVECQAHEVGFREADCSQGDSSRSDLAKSVFHHTKLREANFIAAIDYHIGIFKP